MATRRRQPEKHAPKLKIPAGEIEDLKDAFDVFDVNKDGRVTEADFLRVMTSLGARFNQPELNRAIHRATKKKDVSFTFYDFLKMTLSKMIPGPEDEEKLFQLFKLFDADGDGFITPNELKVALRKLGENITEAEAKDMVRQVDFYKHGKIDYGEFVVLMTEMA